jgi:DNA helicase HerA-like ATPase
MDEEIRLPDETNRTAIVGRTDSGKTYAAVWILSQSNFDEQPWVIVDYKNDDLINSIARAQTIDYETIPDEPGIYILKVLPDEEEQLSNFFKRVWEHEDVGLYIDEGYLVDPRDKWFNACLTQGRSKHIPMIVLSQRPVWLSRFVFSEASFFQVFGLTNSDDMDVIGKYIRDEDQILQQPLEQYHSFYYDVGQQKLIVLGPVPDEEILLATIDAKLYRMELDAMAPAIEPGPGERPKRRAL